MICQFYAGMTLMLVIYEALGRKIHQSPFCIGKIGELGMKGVWDGVQQQFSWQCHLHMFKRKTGKALTYVPDSFVAIAA